MGETPETFADHMRHVLEIDRMSASERATRNYVECEVNGKTHQTLVDSGAVVSCISEKAFEKLCEDHPISPCRYGVIGAGNHQLQVVGLAKLPIDLGTYSTDHVWTIIRGLTNKVILGNDFLMKHNCVGAFGQYLMVGNNRLP